MYWFNSASPASARPPWVLVEGERHRAGAGRAHAVVAHSEHDQVGRVRTILLPVERAPATRRPLDPHEASVRHRHALRIDGHTDLARDLRVRPVDHGKPGVVVLRLTL